MPNAFHFDGRMAKSPVLTRPNGSIVCKFTLLRNEYAGKDEGSNEANERVVAVQFTAFGKRAEAIAQHVMEGDQIIVDARVGNNNYTDKEGNEVYGFNFIVDDFVFGAPGHKKRELLEKKGDK